MRGQARQRRLIGIGALVALLAVAAAALAGTGRLATRSASKTVPPEADRTATAKCTGEANVVSGGFKNRLEPGQLQQYASRRKGSGGWSGSAYNHGSEPAETKAFAYCGGGALDARSKAATIPGTPIMAPLETGSATVKCPSGTSAVSGGFANPNFTLNGDYEDITRVIPYVSRRRQKDKWTVEGQNRGGAEGTLVAAVYCREGRAPAIRHKSVEFSSSPSEVKVGTVVAKCDRDERVVAGGFKVAGIEPSPLASVKSGGRGWKASAAIPYPGPTRVTAYAYCDPA